MNRRKLSQRIGRFLSGKGFYIALSLCLAVICVSGYFLWQDVTTAAELSAQTSRSQAVVVESTKAEEKPTVTETDPADRSDPADEEDAIPDTDALSEEEIPVTETIQPEEPTVTETITEAVEPVTETAEPEPLHGWLYPLEGAVVSAFSSDELTYNEAMGDWRTHNGIDLSAELGQEVHSVCAGQVLSVESDPLLGQTVLVDCGNGLTVQYSNLSEETAVTAGQELSAGDLIGTVGDTAVGEVQETPWLHLAVERDGQPVNPSSFLQGTNP